MRRGEEWDDGPSILFGPAEEVEPEAVPEEEPDQPDRPARLQAAPPAAVRRRSSFGVRLLLTAVVMILVLIALVGYSVLGRSERERIMAEQQALWGRVDNLEGRLRQLELKLPGGGEGGQSGAPAAEGAPKKQ